MVDTSLVRLAYVLGSATALAGCSLLYNPGNLPGAAVDAAPEVDAPTVVDPTDLTLTSVGPTTLYEGQGDGGSRKAMLTIVGNNIAMNATVELVAAEPDAQLALDLEHAVRSASGTAIAIPLTAPIDRAHDARDVKLTVRVSQPTPDGGTATRELGDAITFRNLPELTAKLTNPALLEPLYSQVQVTDAMTFASCAATPVVIRAVASIELGDVHVDASGQAPGCGGAAGGAKVVIGGGPGGGMPAALIGAGLVVAASGGGFAEAGGPGLPGLLGAGSTPGGPATGDELLRAFPTGSSGGGGGGSNPGGGGGGALELTAGGTLTARTLTANGGVGGADGLLTGAGGGGSGGVVLLRSGATATIAKVTVDGGLGGPHVSTPLAVAGAGSQGRLRYDVVKLAGTPDLPPARRAGVVFADPTPLVVTERTPRLTVNSAVSPTAAMNEFDYYVFNDANATVDSGSVRLVTATVVLSPQLAPGLDRICVTPSKRDPIKDVALTTCTEVAYVP